MAVDPKIGAAFIDGGIVHRIGFRRLLPFSLWHLFMLQAIDSPFVHKGEVRRFDLRVAVGVCSLRYPDSRIRRPRYVGRDLRMGVRKFLHYVGDYLSKPEYVVIPRDGTTPPPPRGSAPETLQIVWDVLDFTHWEEEKVWNLPAGKGFAYQAGAMRSKGLDMDFMTPEERAYQDALEAEREAERKAPHG
jgi:hypothetical protein